MTQIFRYDMDLGISINGYEAKIPVTVHYTYHPMVAGNAVDEMEPAHCRIDVILLRGTNNEQGAGNLHLAWLLNPKLRGLLGYSVSGLFNEIEAEILDTNHGD